MRIIQYFAIAWLGLTVMASAQTTNQISRAMSLQDCILVALRHNLDVQIKRYNPEISRYTLNAVYGSYDPSFAFSGSHEKDQQPGGFDSQNRPYPGSDTETDSFNTGIQGLLPWGLNYNLGGSVADTYGTRPGFITDPNNPNIVTNSFVDINTGNTISYLSTNATLLRRDSFENTIGTVGLLQLRQPLLKNFWIDSTRLQIFLDKQNVKISELDLRSQLMTTITAVEEAYYDLIFALDNVKVQRNALELADQLVAENKKRVEVGAMAPLDAKQSESQAASSRADLLAAQGAADTQQRVLKNLLSDDYTKWKDVIIRPTQALFAMPQKFNLQTSWQKGLSQRPDLLQQRVSLEKQGVIVRYQRNQLYPQLDLIGTYGYNASGKNYSDAFDQFSGRDNPFYSIGAAVTIPLGDTASRNNYKGGKATKEQIALQVKQLEQTVMIQIENAIAVSETNFERVKATKEASLYAEAALDAEQKKLENGKSTSFVVLQLQKDLTSARSAEIRALADYNNALARLALNEGSTLEQNKLTVEVK